MPPNVKEVANALASLDLSNHLVLSKYAPLTSDAETASSSSEERTGQQHDAAAASPGKTVVAVTIEEQQQQQKEQGKTENVTSDAISDSYWDMPHKAEETEEDKRQKMIDEILREEKIRQYFSADRIERTLVAEAAAERQQDEEVEEYVTRSSDADAYWDMSEEQPAENDAEQQEGETETAISLSVSQIEKLLLAEGRCLDSAAAEERIIAPHVGDPTHPMANYWDWDTSPKTEEQRRAALIRRILDEDAARLKMSASGIERTLVVDDDAPLDEAVRSPADADADARQSYWTWRSRDEDYVEAPHVRDPNHPMANYWDWDSDPKTPDEQRAIVIDWILREERARQAVGSEGIVERLVDDAAARARREEKEQQQEQEQEVIRGEAVAAGGAEGYWDW